MFEIAIACQWLPQSARIDNPEWQNWLKQLLDGRFSRVRRDEWDLSDVEAYLFVPFPEVIPGSEGSGGTDHRGEESITLAKGEGTKRFPATIDSPVAASRMEDYMKANGLSQSTFALQVITTDRTLRSFRKTGKVRRDIFEAIAKAMGTTKEALLKPE